MRIVIIKKMSFLNLIRADFSLLKILAIVQFHEVVLAFASCLSFLAYNTRRRNHVHQVSVSTAQYKKSTYNACTLLYNALPDDIKQLKSVHKFKFKVNFFCCKTVSIQLETILIVKRKIMFIVTKQRYIMN